MARTLSHDSALDMASRKYLSFKWRLFIPLVILIWLLIFVLFYSQLRREREMLAELLGNQLEMVNDRVILAHENGMDLRDYMDFMSQYLNNEFDNEIRISVYDLTTDSLVCQLGEPIPNIKLDSSTHQGLTSHIGGDGEFFYTIKTDNDESTRVMTALPYEVTIMSVLKGSLDMLLLFFGIAVAMTMVAYFATHYIGYIIKRLRELAKHAAIGEEIAIWEQFPRDELGEIANSLYNIFNKSVHEQKKLETEQRLALKAVKEKEELKRSLTNNINHELKTPVGIVKGYIDTVVQNPDMDEKQRTVFLNKAQQNIDRLCILLNDLSTITRLEEGHESININKINFHEFVLTLVAELRDSGELGNMRFSFDIPLDCVVEGNSRLLASVISNLAKNSVAYSQGTEMSLYLAGKNDLYYTFVFYDNGVGVPPRHVSQLFERFFRIDTGRARKTGGTGLGLPIVRSSIKTMGGNITVDNRADGGLEFTFTLPRGTRI